MPLDFQGAPIIVHSLDSRPEAGVHPPFTALMDTVIGRVLENADSQPDALAFIAEDRRLTYGELCRPVRPAAAWLYRFGVRAGDVVALSLGESDLSGVRSIRALYALTYLGAVILPLYPDVPLSRRRELIDRFGARWIVTREPGESTPGCPAIDPDAFEWDFAGVGGAAAHRGDVPEWPFLFHFSGGTTGVPKALLFTHDRFLESLRRRASASGITPADRMMPSRPWPTLPGLRYMLRMHVIGGAFINIPCCETRDDLENVIRDTGMTRLVASPWQLRRLLASPPPAGRRGPEPKALYLGGGFVSPAEIQAARDSITPNVYLVYSSSESGPISMVGPGDPVGAPGNCGKLLPGVEGRVTGDDGHVLPAGAPGNLGFRAPWIADRYAFNEKASAERFRDGWYYPGDIGMIDTEGRVTVQGRADDVINYGGVKILPAETETVVAQHPDVADAAVIGVPHAMAGAVPVALVVLRRPVEKDALAAYCRERLDGSQLPVAFVQVPEIARSADGKILRKAMIEKYRLIAE
jgi:long-chain acyl-CoA synthetase